MAYGDHHPGRKTVGEFMRPQTEFVGKLTGKTYDSLEAMNYYERREAMHRGGPTPEDEFLDGLSTEQIRALDERVRKTEKERLDTITSSQDTSTFLALHPEYIDSPENAAEVTRCLYARGQHKNPTLYQVEDAVETLKAGNLLKLNQAVLERQENEAAQERARQVQARGGVRAVAANMPTESENELDNMPLDELRRRATVAAAEEEGYNGF